MAKTDKPSNRGQVAVPAPPTNMINQSVFNASLKIHSINLKVLNAPMVVKRKEQHDQTK